MEAKFLSSRFTRRSFLAGLGATAALPILAACQPQVVEKIVEKPVIQKETVVVEKVVEKEVIVEKPVEVVKEVIVEKDRVVEVEKVVTAAPAMAPKVDLRISHWYGKGPEELYGTFPTYRLVHPNVKIIDERNPWKGYHDKLLTQIAAGSEPDVFLVDAQLGFAILKSGRLAAFDDALKAAEIKLEDFSADPRTTAGHSGKIYGLDLFIGGHHGHYINKTMADEVGVKLPEWGTPEWDTWRWDTDLLPWLKAGTKTKSDGTVEQYGVLSPVGGFHIAQLNMIVSAGGSLFDWEGWWNFDESRFMLNEPKAIAGIQRLVDLIHVHKVAPSADIVQGMQEEGGPFVAGKAMAAQASFGAYRFQNVKFEKTLISLPYIDERTVVTGANYWSVSAASKIKDVGLGYAIFAVTDDTANQLFTQNSVPTSYKTRKYLDRMREGELKIGNEARAARTLGASAVPEIAKTVKQFPWSFGGKAPLFVEQVMNDVLQVAFNGELSVKDAMTEAQARIDPKIK